MPSIFDISASGKARRSGTVFCQLIRWRLSFMVSISALAGYSLHPAPHGRPLPLLLAIFFLAAGGTALNQVQERDLDARMERTRGRPLPSGSLLPRTAFLIALALLLLGLAFLVPSGILPLAGGLVAIILYNAVYTPLKPRSFFAVLPGALCGAMPPLIGWTAAGGYPSDFRIVLLAGLLFLWQVPHFWIFAEQHRQDYRRAGLPLLETSFAPAQIRQLVFVWSLALTAAIVAIAAFALIRLPFSRALTYLCALLLFALALDIRQRFNTAPAQLFHQLTGGIAVILAGIILNRWIFF